MWRWDDCSASSSLSGLFITLTGLTVLSSRAQLGIQPVQQVIIPVNKSVTMTTPASFSSAVVGSPEIADALPMTDRTLLIQAKKIGTTNVSIYDENSRLVKVVDVQVTLDTGNLQSRIRALTGDRGIHVSTDNGQVVLSGVASNGPAADQAVNLAKSWSPNGAVINAMNIASPQQVMLKVRFGSGSQCRSRARNKLVRSQRVRNPWRHHRARRSYHSAARPWRVGITNNNDCRNGNDEFTRELPTLGNLRSLWQRHFPSCGNAGGLERRGTFRYHSRRNRQ